MLGRSARQAVLEPAYMTVTFADIEAATKDLGFKPTTPIDVGIPRFVEWYRAFYKV